MDRVKQLATEVAKFILELENKNKPINLIGIKVPAADLYQKIDAVCCLTASVQLYAQEILESEGYKKRFIVIPVGTSDTDEIFDFSAGVHTGFQPEPIKKIIDKVEVEKFKQQLDSCKTINDLFKFMGIKPEEKKDKED